MSLPFLGPTDPRASRAEVFLGYLDYFRSVEPTPDRPGKGRHTSSPSALK